MNKDIAFIEYQRNLPFSVCTFVLLNDGSPYLYNWDFEYSKAYKSLMFNKSGGGLNSVCLNKLANPKHKVKFYLNYAIPLEGYTEKGKIFKITRQKQWEKMGYERIYEPLMTGKSRNPFDDAWETEMVYCRTCNDWFPDEESNFCKHLAWCDTCGAVVHINLKTNKHSSYWDEDKHDKNHPLYER